ncbi:MAG: hypothetical protein QW705_05060 [Zestosphaera sp.]
MFEGLSKVKRRKFTRSPTVNRKMSRFAKRQLLTHAVTMSLRYGLRPVLADPRGITSSPIHPSCNEEVWFR